MKKIKNITFLHFYFIYSKSTKNKNNTDTIKHILFGVHIYRVKRQKKTIH